MKSSAFMALLLLQGLLYGTAGVLNMSHRILARYAPLESVTFWCEVGWWVAIALAGTICYWLYAAFQREKIARLKAEAQRDLSRFIRGGHIGDGCD